MQHENRGKLSITKALELAISALNQIPNSGFTGLEGVRNTYKLIPMLESALATHGATLENISNMTLWGEQFLKPEDKAEAASAGEYDKDQDCYNPSADSESTMLREAVEGVRGVLWKPYDRDKD